LNDVGSDKKRGSVMSKLVQMRERCVMGKRRWVVVWVANWLGGPNIERGAW